MGCTKDNLWGYLADFGGQNPIDAVVCPFAGPNGAGIGVPVFALLFIGVLGMALAVRTQHPAPLLVAGMLSAGLFATALPPGATVIFAIVLLFGIIAGGVFLYQRFRTTL